jgi:hypothetical protein
VIDNNPSVPLPVDDYVVLDSLDPFVESVQLVSWNLDVPLLSFKLSIDRSSNHSIIGFSISHVVGKSKLTFLYNHARQTSLISTKS